MWERIYFMSSVPRIGGRPSRWPPGCGRARSTSSSARSTSSAPANCCGACCEADRLGSLIFYGPPGTGKTALAHVIANQTQSRFRHAQRRRRRHQGSPRELLEEARAELETGGRRTDPVRR